MYHLTLVPRPLYGQHPKLYHLQAPRSLEDILRSLSKLQMESQYIIIPGLPNEGLCQGKYKARYSKLEAGILILHPG